MELGSTLNGMDGWMAIFVFMMPILWTALLVGGSKYIKALVIIGILAVASMFSGAIILDNTNDTTTREVNEDG